MSAEDTTYYTILGVLPDATQVDIRQAYLRQARECHPDKNPEEEAKERFQLLQKVYSVLSDTEKRESYDKNGELEVDDNQDGRQQLNKEDIISFAREYLTSEIEKEDLFENYKNFKGDMRKVFRCQILSDPELDGHRFAKLIEEAIEAGTLKKYKTFEKWADKISKTKEIKFCFEDRLKRQETDNDMQLVSQIKGKSRAAAFTSHLEDLEAKYCPTGSKQDEIDDEEFQRIQDGLLAKSKDRKAKTDKKKIKKQKKNGK